MAALSRAFDDVRRRQAGAVPPYLRSVHPYQHNKLKEGGGYRYPHNEPEGFVVQEYGPWRLPVTSKPGNAGFITVHPGTETSPKWPNGSRTSGGTLPRCGGLVGVQSCPRSRALSPPWALMVGSSAMEHEVVVRGQGEVKALPTEPRSG